jgi:4-aminobutyrate aminotransferase-like enzyme
VLISVWAVFMSDDLLQRRLKAMGPAYRLFYNDPVHLVRGEDVWLYDADGARYLDCYNNVASVGHCHPRVVAALHRQAQTLNTHTRYLHENVVEYAERIGATLPAGLEVCMLVCTGTEATDLAFRIARTVTGHNGAIVLEHAYHGNSVVVTELSTEMYPASERPDYLEAVEAPDTYRGTWGPDEPGSGALYAGRIGEAVDRLAARGQRPAMFISDNIFSSNGVLTPPPEYLQEAYRLIRAAGGLAIADEVQSGLCRLGDHFWGFEDSGVVPDIVTMGKPMGDGHPLAAVVTTRGIAERFASRFNYFNTFGGNPVSAAVGLAVLDVIDEEGIQQNVRDTGQYLAAGLRELAGRHASIGDVRGKGLFFGVELVGSRDGREAARAEAERVRDTLRANGVLLSATGPLGNVLKIRPPMTFSREHADLLLDRLDQALVVP